VSGLANNGDFLKDNSQLPDFLNAHPYVQSTMREDPVGFMQRVRGFEMNGTSYDNDAMNRAKLAKPSPTVSRSPLSRKRARAVVN